LFDYPSTTVGVGLGLTIMAVAGIVIILANRELGVQYSRNPTGSQRLVGSGIYSSVRYPIHLGETLFGLGTLFFLGSRISWIFFPLWLFSLRNKIQSEEWSLINEFPEYKDYIEKTKQMIPWVL
ncbi:methyltransferase family protein, partial [Candidatus Altiarchaeota archaeon]